LNASDPANPLDRYKFSASIVQSNGEFEEKSVASVLSVNNEKETRTLVDDIRTFLQSQKEMLLQELVRRSTSEHMETNSSLNPLTLSGGPGDKRIPVRTTRGPLDFGLPANKLSGPEAEWYRSRDFPLDGDMRFELVNFIDGKRTVADIARCLVAEFHRPLEEKVVGRYLEDLAKTGVVKWKP
ncbi:MAG TPA: hypothetical protein VI704_03910, partial [Bacteroidota bacterium]|nr:hypothetical protein [Bacteroidota bacterium]